MRGGASHPANNAADAKFITEAGVGSAFLAAKRRALLGDEQRKERAAEVERWLAERLAGGVREARGGLRPAGPLVFAAAHLVERARLEEYRARLRSALAERGELHFLTSGPWPPYSFSGE